LGLSQLKNELIGDAKSEAKRIAQETEKEKKEILKEAEKKKAAVLAEAEKEANALVEDEKREQYAAIQLKAKRVVSEAKENTVNQNMDKVWKEFAKAGKDKNYPALMQKLIKQGLESLGEQAVVQVNAKDKSLAGKYAKNINKTAADISGGAIISSSDGRIIINNSLEALYDEHKEEIRRVVFGQLFGGETVKPAQAIISQTETTPPKTKGKAKAAKRKGKPKDKTKKGRK
jgi:vacuolar-type H+-ATPase subunit E/Vma4